MTTMQIRKTLSETGKPVCQSHLYRLLTLLQIKPLGRSRPQQYPADTAERILSHLGFTVQDQKHESPLQKENRIAAAFGIKPVSKLISLRTVKGAKPQHITKGTK